MTSEPPSGLLYSAVTKYWPRIISGLLLAAGVAEVVLGSNSPGFTVGFYVFAFATTTGGVWFLFELAEKALSDESRGRVVGLLREANVGALIESLPSQFVAIFDRVFGTRHWSWKCFYRSSFASLVTVLLVFSAWLATGATINREGLTIGLTGPALVGFAYLYVVVFSGLLNFIPDYLSLLETRWAIGVMARSSKIGRVLALDILLTALISAGVMYFQILSTSSLGIRSTPAIWASEFPSFILHVASFGLTAAPQLGEAILADVVPMWVFFYSAFFTSVWLWLYVASVFLSRFLLRLNAGVGLLLRVTDVERHPFRSMGFVSVIIVSVIFAMGLPLVLL